jgi:MarR family transcriptional regulator, organic hydroperoxide resistance regulator
LKASESKYCKCMYFSSSALARKVEKLAIQSWKPVGLAPSHAYLLILVNNDPGISPTALTEQLLLAPSTITRLLEKLEEKKLIVRTTTGKTTSVYGTPKAKNLQPELQACLQHFYQTYSQILGVEQSAALVKNMNSITDILP